MIVGDDISDGKRFLGDQPTAVETKDFERRRSRNDSSSSDQTDNRFIDSKTLR